MQDLYNEAAETAKSALEADKNGEYEKAYELYIQALERLKVVMRYEKNEFMMRKAMGYLERAETLKKIITKKSCVAIEESTPPTMDNIIVSEKPNVRWGDVAGLHVAKETLKEAVLLPQRFPKLFTGERKPWVGILLYGPPGTGKSFLAKAVATEADSTFFSVSSSDLVSKWQGESEKLVKELFKMAREQSPSIIFIDEIDSLCSARQDGDNESTRRIKTEFLVQMDGVKNNGATDRVLVLGATNTPWSLDPGIRRRFEKRIYIPLPDELAREQMFRLNIGRTPHSLTNEDFRYLAQQSEGLSGADISIAVRTALMEPLRVAQTAAYFTMDSDGMYTPLREATPCLLCPMVSMLPCTECGLVRMNLYDIDNDKLRVPDITFADFQKAMACVNASVAPDELGEFETWTKSFGSYQ